MVTTNNNINKNKKIMKKKIGFYTIKLDHHGCMVTISKNNQMIKAVSCKPSETGITFKKICKLAESKINS